MVITLGNLIIWLIIAALVGIIGEMIARRRTPFGIVGAIILGFIAIFLVVGLLHWHITGEPYLNGVPLITSILAAAVIVAIWSAFAYRHAYGYYYRRGGYVRRPHRRYRWF
ncbi:MAG: GlsB/YeaQ/YmgE family stress response membrane protein [Ktedonobacteraceae bacterium]